MRRLEGESFQELMAAELRHGPWLALSLLLHAVLLFVLWLSLPERDPVRARPATITIDLPGSPPIEDRELLAIPDVLAECDPELPITIDDPPEPVEVEIVEEERPMPPAPLAALKSNPRLSPRSPTPTTSAPRRSGSPEIAAIGSDGFRSTVAELQRTGLEIVFVFDSTGSMGLTIYQTKQTIAEMLDVLRALVPDARIGLVTYRDRGRDAEYVVRELPLGSDFWRAANFVQDIRAEGGGDRPEAVYEGLNTAFEQRWKRGSKRVVILAGDAPAHPETLSRLKKDVARFARRENSHVHALVTSPLAAGRDTRKDFELIARLGKGECLSLDRRDEILQRVLGLAFGRQFDGDLAAVRRLIAEARSHTETWALDLAHRGGSELASALRQQPVDPALLHALVRMPRRRITRELIDQLTSSRTPDHTRQAIAWALQRIFDLPLPPIDSRSGRPIRGSKLRELRHLADRLPR